MEFRQDGAVRADYGTKLIPNLAATLTAEFGKGFDSTNLRKMGQFFRYFPIGDAVRLELSWTHCRILLRAELMRDQQWFQQRKENGSGGVE